jgi:hypothetical protein
MRSQGQTTRGWTRTGWATASALALLLGGACSVAPTGDQPAGTATAAQSLHATIGPEGGVLVGQPGTPYAGVRLDVPAGALAAPTDIAINQSTGGTPLPAAAVECGPMFALSPAGLTLAKPAELSLPFDQTTVRDHYRFDDEVKVWMGKESGWGQKQQVDNANGTVTIEVDSLTVYAAGVNPPVDVVSFQFAPNPKFLRCLSQYPDDPSKAPVVEATVVRGELNDGMFLRGRNIKPGLAFDLFTVQNSSLDATGKPDPTVKNFGLAWYQSDLEAKDNGKMRAELRTILLDQIFGFDPVVSLPPTGTFEVGFWFNNPDDAQPCSTDPIVPTPFNGEHHAGPLAMITLPNATTGLGPLCTKPDTSVTPARCDP